MLRVSELSRPGLAPASFTLEDGECVAVRGPSGAGKTLLLRALADLDPNQGAVELDGQRREWMAAPRWRRLVRYVAAESAWWADVVSAHFPDPVAAAPLVAALGLPDESLDWPVARLSSGERQRLGLARALADAPRVLLLDEPTAALDAAARDGVERLVVERRRAGAAVLWVTHDPAQARRIARRTLEVETGTVREGRP